jgi:hypothetical protein
MVSGSRYAGRPDRPTGIVAAFPTLARFLASAAMNLAASAGTPSRVPMASRSLAFTTASANAHANDWMAPGSCLGSHISSTGKGAGILVRAGCFIFFARFLRLARHSAVRPWAVHR